MTRMMGGPDTNSPNPEYHRAKDGGVVDHINQLRELWQVVSDRDFELNYRSKYFGDSGINRGEALELLHSWEQRILARRQAHEAAPLRILWEVPSIQRLMWRHLVEFFIHPGTPSFPLPITAEPAQARNVIVRDHFPGFGVMFAVGIQVALLFISVNPLTQHAFQKLDELRKEHSITYYKLSEFLPEVFSPDTNQELPKTAVRIPKRNQTIVSNPPEPDNDLQTIIQPDAPKPLDMAEIKLPNIISVKPEVARPFEPPMPTLVPGSPNALNLPKELLVPISPALPPEADVGRRALADIKIAQSEALNPEPKLMLKPNAEVPQVETLPPTSFGNTFASVPVAKGPDAVPTVTPEIGRFTNVDMPNLVVLNVNPAPPDKDVKVPHVSKAASFGTEEGSGNGGNGGGKAGALNIPNVTVTGGGLTEPGAAVVQTPRLPPQVAANIPPKDRTAPTSTREGAKGQGNPPALVLPKPRRFSVEQSPQVPSPGSSSEARKAPHGQAEKRIYTAYLNLANLSSRSGSWVMRFSEYEDPTLSASRDPIPAGDPDAELSAPRLLHSEHPKYPSSTIYEKVEGDVILSAVIRRDGSVDTIKVVRSVDERLDDSAVEALKHWLFSPSQKNGQPVDVLAEITIPFSLKRIL
ncbi:MAG: TonB family protein [Acidobacteriia bacterium]|nr:TonB family protein [Terriglobia bacterium]